MDRGLINGVVFQILGKHLTQFNQYHNMLLSKLERSGSEVLLCNGFNQIYMKENKFAELKMMF